MKLKKNILLAPAFLYSWILVLLIVGLGLNLIQNPSATSFLGFTVGIGLAYPLKYVYQNLDSLPRQLNQSYSSTKYVLLISSALALVAYLSFSSSRVFPLSNILNLSFKTSIQLFLPLKIIYSCIDPILGNFMFEFSRLYLHVIWIYLLTATASNLISKITARKPEDSLEASILPFTGKKAEIEIYVVTGRHGLIGIPENFCKECNLFYRAAEQASEKIEREVEIEVKSYWTRFLRPLMKGGYHAPVMLINGELVAQGYDVPETEEIVEKLGD